MIYIKRKKTKIKILVRIAYQLIVKVSRSYLCTCIGFFKYVGFESLYSLVVLINDGRRLECGAPFI